MDTTLPQLVPPTPTLETERLVIRPFRPSDLDAFAALVALPEVTRGMERDPYDRLGAWKFLAMILGEWQLAGCGSWAVEEKATGAFIGRGGFTQPPGWPDLELAGILHPDYWGKGYATEAGRALLTHAFRDLGRERVVSLLRPQNTATRRVIEKLGGTFTEEFELEGHHFHVYAYDRAAYHTTPDPGV